MNGGMNGRMRLGSLCESYYAKGTMKSAKGVHPSGKKKQESPGRLPCGRPRPQSEQFHPGSAAELRRVWKDRLDAYLAEHQLKRSEQRVQILELFLEAGAHLSAQELVQKVMARFPGIGAATVYRNLKVLCEAKILRETFSDAKGRAIYEPYEGDEHHHDHMICRDCGAVFEFHSEEIEALQESLLKRQGFREDGHRHVVYVRCERLSG